MSKGINRVTIVGNLGADPETRYSAGGSAITTIKVATSESYTDKTTNSKVERTEWHRIKFFGKLAEIVGEYTKKGRQIYVEGKLRTDKYTDKDGVERYTTDIIADEMQLLGDKPSGSGQPSARAPAPAQRQPAQRSQSNVPPPDEFDPNDPPF